MKLGKKNLTTAKAETLKKNINRVSQKSKDAIKNLFERDSKQLNSALKDNLKGFDSISKILCEKEIDPSIINPIKSFFIKSIVLHEYIADLVMNSHTQRINLFADFSTRITDAVKDDDLNSREGIERLFGMVNENLDKSTELSLQNMENIALLYNDHLNLVLNSNKKLAERIDSKIVSMYKLYGKDVEASILMDMVSNWWKNIGEEITETQ
ncbi:MAG TPA: hypothetical protein VK783_11185 [Bacteroidia bacterium]|nr:hypothetical protein [Bacteroidia bacterium]